MVRKRTLREEHSDNPLRRLFAGADAIGDAHAVIGAAGESETRKGAERCRDARDARLVTNVVLRHRVGMTPDTRKNRLGANGQQVRQLAANVFYHFLIVVEKSLRL